MKIREKYSLKKAKFCKKYFLKRQSFAKSISWKGQSFAKSIFQYSSIMKKESNCLSSLQGMEKRETFKFKISYWAKIAWQCLDLILEPFAISLQLASGSVRGKSLGQPFGDVVWVLHQLPFLQAGRGGGGVPLDLLLCTELCAAASIHCPPPPCRHSCLTGR